MFESNWRKDGARLVSDGPEHGLVILGNRYLRSQEVKPGERWECYIHEKRFTKVAEPLVRIDPPEVTPSPPPAPIVLSPAAPEPASPPPSAGPLVAAPEQVEEPALPPAFRPTGSNGDTDRLSGRIETSPRNYSRPPRPELFTGLDGLVGNEDRVVLFVDGPSMDHASQELGWLIAWHHVALVFQAGGIIAGAYYYALDEGDPRQRAFLLDLARSGYKIRPVSARPEELESGRMLAVTLAIDAATLTEQFDVAFLFTNDRAFVPLVQMLHARNKRVFLVTHDQDAITDLAFYVDKPIFDLTNLEDYLAQ